MQGVNSFGKDYGNLGYRGPMPPKGHGTHHYHFKIYALDKPVSAPPGVDKKTLLAEIRDHALAQGELVGTYQGESKSILLHLNPKHAKTTCSNVFYVDFFSIQRFPSEVRCARPAPASRPASRRSSALWSGCPAGLAGGRRRTRLALSRGYPHVGLKLVGDRHALESRQRLAVSRSRAAMRMSPAGNSGSFRRIRWPAAGSSSTATTC